MSSISTSTCPGLFDSFSSFLTTLQRHFPDPTWSLSSSASCSSPATGTEAESCPSSHRYVLSSHPAADSKSNEKEYELASNNMANTHTAEANRSSDSHSLYTGDGLFGFLDLLSAKGQSQEEQESMSFLPMDDGSKWDSGMLEMLFGLADHDLLPVTGTAHTVNIPQNSQSNCKDTYSTSDDKSNNSNNNNSDSKNSSISSKSSNRQSAFLPSTCAPLPFTNKAEVKRSDVKETFVHPGFYSLSSQNSNTTCPTPLRMARKRSLQQDETAETGGPEEGAISHEDRFCRGTPPMNASKRVAESRASPQQPHAAEPRRCSLGGHPIAKTKAASTLPRSWAYNTPPKTPSTPSSLFSAVSSGDHQQRRHQQSDVPPGQPFMPAYMSPLGHDQVAASYLHQAPLARLYGHPASVPTSSPSSPSSRASSSSKGSPHQRKRRSSKFKVDPFMALTAAATIGHDSPRLYDQSALLNEQFHAPFQGVPPPLQQQHHRQQQQQQHHNYQNGQQQQILQQTLLPLHHTLSFPQNQQLYQQQVQQQVQQHHHVRFPQQCPVLLPPQHQQQHQQQPHPSLGLSFSPSTNAGLVNPRTAASKATPYRRNPGEVPSSTLPPDHFVFQEALLATASRTSRPASIFHVSEPSFTRKSDLSGSLLNARRRSEPSSVYATCVAASPSLPAVLPKRPKLSTAIEESKQSSHVQAEVDGVKDTKDTLELVAANTQDGPLSAAAAFAQSLSTVTPLDPAATTLIDQLRLQEHIRCCSTSLSSSPSSTMASCIIANNSAIRCPVPL